MPGPRPSFHDAGTVADQIDVEITYQIIGLFSEGLYSSPYKAVEELVSNAFDADATNVHVRVSRDLASPDATIAVIDNGTGMDPEGLRVHWIVGDSVKRLNRTTPSGRKTIGKFGIGKLAAYVLGDRLTHITRVDEAFYSVSMDFRRIPQTVSASNAGTSQAAQPDPSRPVQLALRHLSKVEAQAALTPWTDPDSKAMSAVLFGPDAPRTWTVAIISDLKDMAQELTLNRLRWILSTGMPLRDDFLLHLNSQTVLPSKVSRNKRVGRWIVGKDLVALPKPAPEELDDIIDDSTTPPDYRHWYVVDKVLGPMSGYLEIYDAPLDGGKAEARGRSNGFFVYVSGRLVNAEDAGFGIDRNSLRHGTFSRFRFVVNIDRLDQDLRSSRESLKQGPRLARIVQ